MAGVLALMDLPVPFPDYPFDPFADRDDIQRFSTAADASFRAKGSRSQAASERVGHRPPPAPATPTGKTAGKAAGKTTGKAGKIKPVKLRVIGGDKRGRHIWYHGDQATRPMKESLREALFNIVGPAIKGRLAWDLFAGTGILAIESFSRGASRAIAIERSRTFAKTIERNAEAIDISRQQVEVIAGDSFRVAPPRMRLVRDEAANAVGGPGAAAEPLWVVYFCPPYAMWNDQQRDLFRLLETTAQLAPPGSLLVTESDRFFDVAQLPLSGWDVRPKGNMTLAFLET